MEIKLDKLDGPEVARLLQEHLDDMALHSPAESVHALDLHALRQPELSFWCAWDGAELAGCGALKALDGKHGEIKSMRTASSHLRRGVAAKLLEHILAEAQSRGYQRLSLETGSPAAFVPAQRLYQKYGFDVCEPFAHYGPDPYSIFMTRTL